VLDPSRMWYVIVALAAVALGLNWMRQAERQIPAEPVAIVAAPNSSQASTETITRSQCLAQPNRLWVPLEAGVGECIAYIAPEGIATGSTAVLFFEGDFPDEDMAPARMGKIVAAYQRPLTDAQTRFGLPFIVLARPGVMGSSGFHHIGGMREEGETMSAAIDALKERYGYRRIALAGQSGGARIIAQLLVLGRRDILCAAMASGAYGVPLKRNGGQVSTNIFGDPGRRFLVPLHHADGVAFSSERRAFVIGDPRDVRTPYAGQREWAEKLRTLGHHAGMCAAGRTDQDITAQVAADRLLRR
jgi:pimeloyl-ACP methyl ester carboxylesterase